MASAEVTPITETTKPANKIAVAAGRISDIKPFDSVYSTITDEIFAHPPAEVTNSGEWGALREEIITPQELWATARYTGKGFFICFITAREAFKGEWKFLSSRDSEEEIELKISKRIHTVLEKYKVRNTVIHAVSVARSLGQCALALLYTNPETRTGDLVLRIVYYNFAGMRFDENNILQEISGYVMFGMRGSWLKIKATECVFFVNNEDPFQNGYIGISELCATYFPIRYSLNVLESYSNTIMQRGLGLLDVEIPGADQPTIDKYKAEYGTPTQYSVIFHNEYFKIAAYEGIKTGYNIQEIMNVFTRETSSGSGIGEARMNGVQQGRVTGSEIDQDNYASIQRWIQQEYEPSIKKLIHMLDPKLKDQFDIDFPIDIELDRAKQSQIRAMEVKSIMEAPELFDLNYALGLLGMNPRIYTREEFTVADYIEAKQAVSMEPPLGSDVGRELKEEKEFPLDEDGDEGTDKKTNTAERSGMLTAMSSGKAPRPGRSQYNTRQRSTKRSPNFRKKIKNARKYFTMGDSIRIVNDKLKSEFGDGLSNSILVYVRDGPNLYEDSAENE